MYLYQAFHISINNTRCWLRVKSEFIYDLEATQAQAGKE